MNAPHKDIDFENLLQYLRINRGFDFTGYKRSTLMRRVTKQMETLNIDSFGNYQDYLEVHPDEFKNLFNTILINVTAFFRDSSAWDYLAKEIIPNIIKNKPKDELIRFWSAGCASGQEAYTLAIIVAEILGVEEFRQRVKIYATDVDEEALTQARQASYSAKNIIEIPLGLRDKYFDIVNKNYIFRQDLRRCVIFGRHDLLQDAPISRLDLLICRNTLMYFNSEIQGKIINRFHFALNDHGYLFLGKAEMLVMHSNLFVPIDLKNRIFSKVSLGNIHNRQLVMKSSEGKESADNVTFEGLRIRELAFDTASSAQVVIDNHGTLIMINEQARNLFNLTIKDLNRPFQDLELSYRPVELRSLIEQVYSERHPITLTNIERYQANSEVQHLDVRVIPLQDNDQTILGVTISFNDVTRQMKLQTALQRSRQELETTNEELQSTNEELETTNEELQSTNEELETTNEELQSTNQEMETMNEELQSANEELQTINHELSDRTCELDQTNIFLTSILGSLQMGMVVLDSSFNILIWNQTVEDMWGLRTDEVMNKSWFSLDIGLPVEQLRNPIRDIISCKKKFQEIIINANNRRGKKIQCYLACSPLMNGTVEGVIIMMTDIEKIKSMISPVDIEERQREKPENI
ncbi:MAG: chemotaxis protein CheR [Aphanizomenon flos-aquae MDT14a]|jgi:two-component system CheB/CheR fusion protein|uniref:protein-glutamate O-methyltransferase n=1 Tax=Aphanizomenon flos-aquae LD13 TaxID=1710894 RepID=A0A1B7VVE4_APHFL|nr:PAS domain S-box protein [Aphanizomenon flos-aquae UKL13-PB]MBO1060966.1 PAS domain S-box protein [Aphanizomenon flos-aquae CP01]OBQ24886.1 MAG: chemotaxis protein CheR [Aphanizomenon flos-aquae LD13]OBQ29954.1 MAG: chemotaxis protein CheR [Aphanizomenon flos-aquae MDT14a]